MNTNTHPKNKSQTPVYDWFKSLDLGDKLRQPTTDEILKELHSEIEAWSEPENHLWSIQCAAHLIDTIKGVDQPLTAEKDDRPLTFVITATGKVAASLRAIAFVADKSIEAVALDTLIGIDSRHSDPAKLLTEGYNMLDDEEDVAAMVERFGEYRDANDLDYPDFVVEADIAEMQGDITEDERNARVKAGRLAAAKNDGGVA